MNHFGTKQETSAPFKKEGELQSNIHHYKSPMSGDTHEQIISPMHIHSPVRMTKGKVLLFVGAPDNVEELLNDRPASSMDCRAFNNFFKAYTWLAQLAENMTENRIGIVCDYDALHEDAFHFLDSIRKHEKLKNLPFIVLSHTPDELNPVEALKRGIDDCYGYDFDWNDLQKRVEFLWSFKPKMLELQNVTPASTAFTKYQIPTGKRLFDIAVASAALLALSPIMLAVAVAIKIESKGKIVYRSRRVGTGYQVFDFLKFRSMFEGADVQLVNMKHLNQYDEKTAQSSATFIKIKNDPRVTRVGKLIRKTSIDELPQLFNVLNGQMSIIGNRPLPLYEAVQLTKDEWAKRFIAPAGLTGLWQVTKRGTSDMSAEERISLDIKYAEQHSFAMDLKILLKTIPAMIQKESV
jgi:lipopolysaccharide/colanic/teichoic acid biosynthesis glycosyltransferase